MSASWREFAACLGKTDLFFSDNWSKISQAQKLCAGCAVRAECELAGAEEPYGIWGGILKTARTRRPHGCDIDHGTNSGYAQHYRYGEKPCRECKEAYYAYRTAMRAAARALKPPKPFPHGTTRGYNRHRYYKETPCEPCFVAYRAYKRQKGREERQRKKEEAA